MTERQQASITLRLSHAPAAPVQVTLRASSAAKLAVSPAMVVFSPADFDAPRTVGVLALDDDDVLDEVASIALTAEGLGSVTIEVAINDDDGLGIVTSPASRLEVTEGRAEVLGVRLSAQPSAPIVATLVSSEPGIAMLSPTTLTFTPENWEVEQSVSVAGMNDATTTDHDASIQIVGVGLADVAVAVKVFDDDVLGIEPSTSNLGRWLEGTTRTFTVRLLQAPAAAISVGVSSGDAAVWTTSPSTLSFTLATWSTPQTVTVTAPHDVDLADASASITLTAAGLATRTVVGGVRDDDAQGVVVAPGALAVGEGSTAAFDVRLAYRPAQDVTVDVSSLMPAVVSASPSTLTFTPASYATVQTVTVSGLEDPDAAAGIGTVRLQAPLDGLVTDVQVDVADNDTLGIETSLIAVSLSEGGSAAFGVRLTAQPLAAVSVAVATSDTTAATAAPSQLTFDSSNWSSYQTVTVTGVEDLDVAAEAVSVILTAAGLTSRVVATTIGDNDTQELLVSPGIVNLTEGGTAPVTVRLRYQPPAPVTVSVSSVNTAVATVAPTTLSFNATDYAIPKTTTIAAVHDANATNNATTLSISATGIAAVPVTVNVTDDDTLAIQTDVVSVVVSEGGAVTFGARLTAQPAAALTVAVVSNDASAATVSPAALTFTTTNWNTYQPVSVSGVEDADVAGESAAVVLSSAGLGNANVAVTVTDNDSLSLLTSVASLATSEGGAATFGVRLSAMPAGDVVVAVTSSDAGAAVASPAALTFTPGNWGVEQVVTVSGVADADVANEAVSITCSSAGFASRTVATTVIDDDTQAVLVTSTSVAVVEGATASFGVMLQFIPSGTLTVSVASSNVAAATVSPVTLSFTAADYNLPRTVIVTGAQDANASPESVTVTATAPGATSAAVAVAVTDNDTQGILVSPSALSILESSGGSFEVRLTAQPTVNVTVSCVSTDSTVVYAVPGSLTFTADDWGTSQTVWVSPMEDEDPQDESTAVHCTSPGLTPRTVNVTVIDDRYCGDGLCRGSESMATCPEDCTCVPQDGLPCPE